MRARLLRHNQWKARSDVADRSRVHGARVRVKNMPYRDPAQRAAWVREYRKRKRAEPLNGIAERELQPSIEGALPAIMRKADSQTLRLDDKSRRREAVKSFKTALELARSFPFGLRASQVCPYCYNTGYSSPGTQCSYCRSGER